METQDHSSLRNYKRTWFHDFWGDSHRTLLYTNEPFNNLKDLIEWRNLGYTQERFTGDLYDMRNPEPEWMQEFRVRVPVQNFSWSIYRMRPGDVLPNHSDTYAAFRRVHNLSDHDTICRYVVFLEDWQSGHYFEIDGEPITGWIRGTAIAWQDGTPHLAANMGKTDRYTLQLTGVASLKKQNWGS
jgi:hypothetical protein